MSVFYTDSKFVPVMGTPWLTTKLPPGCLLIPPLQWNRGENGKNRNEKTCGLRRQGVKTGDKYQLLLWTKQTRLWEI